jgi:hypothetical protein
MGPGKAAAQRENAVSHRKGFVGAKAELAARIGDVLGAIGQRKGVGADKGLLGITRQIEGRELSGSIGRDADTADPRHDKTITAFKPPGERIGVELRAELIGAGRRHGAVGGDLLPAIGQCG